MKYCRICKVELTSENTTPSQIKHGINLCKKCKQKIKSVYYKTKKGKLKQQDYKKSTRTRDKSIVFNHYSNGIIKCACCGDNHKEFLTIDHINGDGAAHRKLIGRGGDKLYAWLIRNNFPEGYRVLCMNCNWAIGIHGYCPHEHRK